MWDSFFSLSFIYSANHLLDSRYCTKNWGSKDIGSIAFKEFGM
jgi:hypothetical protein